MTLLFSADQSVTLLQNDQFSTGSDQQNEILHDLQQFRTIIT
jgi:hypothetical protein